MQHDEPLDPAQLNRRESKVTRQCDRGQPELRRIIITVDVDVRRLVQVVADEVDAIRTAPKNRGHPSIRARDDDAHEGEVRLRGFYASMRRIVDALLSRHLREPAQRVDQSHLLDRARA